MLGEFDCGQFRLAVVAKISETNGNVLLDFGPISNVPIGCFPDLYKALSANMPDQVITL